MFERIDIYDVDTRSWELSPVTMPVPRHGHYPILYEGGVLVVGGGEKKGFAVSNSVTYLPLSNILGVA